VADVDSPPTGTFCWPELATSDQSAGVAFYCNLFGWDVHEHSMGPDGVYSMFQLRGREVAAAYTLRPKERPGVPPHWNSYVAVKSADEAVQRAQQLGGTVLAPAFDVPDAGRMAVLQDPTGTVFQVWEAKRHPGARVLGEPGALCWTELATADTSTAKKFYTSLFGWKEKTSSDAGIAYTEFSVGDRPIAGMMEMAGVPPHWLPYFQVADCDSAAAKATELGATYIVPPRDIPNVGRFAVIRDPQGAVFAIFKPARG
jgi:predicted enzyme related to lactoylglutathione lyase